MRVLRLLSFLLLAACGQSGDLYLPPERPPAQTKPAAPAEPPQEQEKDKK